MWHNKFHTYLEQTHEACKIVITKSNFEGASCVYRFMKTYLFSNILLYKLNNFKFKGFSNFQEL
jgi:hypothetical protein